MKFTFSDEKLTAQEIQQRQQDYANLKDNIFQAEEGVVNETLNWIDNVVKPFPLLHSFIDWNRSTYNEGVKDGRHLLQFPDATDNSIYLPDVDHVDISQEALARYRDTELNFSEPAQCEPATILSVQNIFIQEFNLNPLQAQLNLELALANNIKLDDIGQNLQQLKQNLAQLSKKKAEQQERKECVQAINVGLDFIQQLGALTGCKEMQQFATVTKHVVTIANVLTNIAIYTASGAAVGMGIGAIAGAVVGIITTFMSSGPSPTQIMMEQLGKLSEQINDLGRFLDKKLNQVLDYQRITLQIMVDGFNQLNKLIVEQNLSLRIELRASLAEIQQTLDFLVNLQQHNVENILLQDSRILLNQVEAELVKGNLDKPNFDRLSNALVARLNADPYNPSLTGVSFYKADPSLAKLIAFLSKGGECQIDYNTCIGFFSQYAQNKRHQNLQLRASANEELAKQNDIVPNPRLWYQLVDNYFNLNYRFLSFDNDPYNFVLDGLGAKAQKELEAFKDLVNDPMVWDGLFADYYSCLDKIQTSFDRFVADYNFMVQTELNGKQCGDIRDGYLKPQPNDITGLNILAPVSKLVDKFMQRSANRIVKPIIITSNRRYNFCKEIFQDLSRLSLYEPLFSREILPSKLLCAEYLGNIEFIAELLDIATLTQLDFKTLTQEEILSTYKYLYTLKPSDFFTALVLKLQFKSDPTIREHKVVNLICKGAWDNESVHNITVFAHIYDDSIISHCPITGAKTTYDKEAGRNRFRKHIRRFNELEKYSHHWNDSTYQLDSEIERKVEATTNQWFFGHRQEIHRQLFGANAAPKMQAYAQDFRQSLLELNSHVFLLQSFAYLAGINVADTPLSLLLTSQDVEQELKTKLVDNTQPELQLDMLAPIKQALEADNKLTYANTIQPAAKLEPLPDLHPQSLLEAGIAKLGLLKLFKAAYRIALPHLSQHIDGQVYDQHYVLTQADFLQGHIYQMLQDLYTRDFERARLWSRIHFNVFTDISEQECKKYLAQITTWILNSTKDNSAVLPAIPNHLRPLPTHEVAPIVDVEGDLIKLAAELALNNQFADNTFIPYINHCFSGTYSAKDLNGRYYLWPKNIKLLTAFAKAHGNVNFNHFEQPFHFVMWLNGTITYRNLLLGSSPRMQETLFKVHGYDNQLNLLRDFSVMGIDLRLTIYELATATRIFDYLFGNYTRLATELLAVIQRELELQTQQVVKNLKLSSEQALDVEQQENITKSIVARFFRRPIPGEVSALLDTLDALGLLSHAYLEMVFGYELISKNSKLHGYLPIKFKSELITYLSDDKQSYRDYPLAQRLADYITQIQGLQKVVYQLSSDFAELYQLAENLASQLALNNGQLKVKPVKSKAKLTPHIVGLLDQLLEGQYIHSLQLSAFTLTQQGFTQLIGLLTKHYQLTHLELSELDLGLGHLVRLLPCLSNMPSLTSLNLSHNRLGKDDIAYSALLTELIPQLSFLTELKLADNQLNDENISALSAAILLQANRIQSLDLSDNSISIEAYPAIAALWSQLTELKLDNTSLLRLLKCKEFTNARAQNPNITQLSFANLGLTSDDLLEILPSLSLLSNLSELDLSSNSLNLANNQRGLGAAANLSDFFASLPQLQVIKLNGCGLDIESICAVLAACVSNRMDKSYALAAIELQGNAVTADELKEVVADIPWVNTQPIKHKQKTEARFQVVAEASKLILSKLSFGFAGIGVPELDRELSALLQTRIILQTNRLCEQTQSHQPIARVLADKPLLKLNMFAKSQANSRQADNNSTPNFYTRLS